MEDKKLLITILLVIITLFLIACSTSKPFQPPKDWETYKLKQDQIEYYLRNNYLTNHFIEGVWQVSLNYTFHSVSLGLTDSGYNPNMYYIAIIRENINDSDENNYLIVIVGAGSTDWNFPGRIKGRITRINNNSYTVDWYNQQYNLVSSTFHFNSYDELYGNFQYTENNIMHIEDFTFTKIYPQEESIENPNEEDERNNLSYGSGILISNRGHVITNYHVVKDAIEIIVEIPSKNISKHAMTILSDMNNDIAILKLADFKYDSVFTNNIPFTFSDVNKIKLGQSVFSLGYPLGEILGNTPRVSTGIINSLFGVNDDPRLFQISIPLQPGNSGSPLFNMEGEILGLVVASLDAKYFYENLGIIPQNVNFAIKNEFILNLIDSLSNSIILNDKNLLKGLSLEDQIDKIQPFILKINVSK